MIDTLNFSFWEENPSDLTHILYNGKEYSGYWGLCAAINRAVQVHYSHFFFLNSF